MKVTPVTEGSGVPAGQDVGQQKMPADRIAAAKAVAAGKSPIRQAESDTPVDEQVARTQRSLRKIKMRTNVSTDRDVQALAQPPGEVPVAMAEEPAESGNSDSIEQANEVSEVTKPLSPQLAALARQRRALQVKERELTEREAKLTPPNMEEYVSKAELLANPLKVFEAGVTYDQLTEAVLSNQSGINPEIQELRREIKALKEGVDKNLTERDTQAVQQVLSEMTREAKTLVAQGEEYELVREHGYAPKAVELVHQTWKKTGEIMDISEALTLVETELLNDALKIARLNKIQSKLTPPQFSQQQAQTKTMRTLTNRDGAAVPMDKRQRALAAFHGTLRK